MRQLSDNLSILSPIEEAGRPDYSVDLVNRVSAAIEKTRRYYAQMQHVDGYWWYELESNVTITAEYLMLLHFAGIMDKERDSKIAGHILKHQRPDGTWSIHWGGSGDLSTTVEAYFALKLSGLSQEDHRLIKAREFIMAHGGVGGSRFFTKIFLALFGQYDWKDVPSVPVEIVLLPRWFPLNIYNFSSWARATLVPLSIVLDIKPVRAIPVDRGVRELYREQRPHSPDGYRAPFFSWKRFFTMLDGAIKATEENPLRPFRKRGLEAALRWVLAHQEETGDWAGIQPAMVNSILALLSLGHDLSYEPIQKGLDALQRFTVERDDEILLQSCISPVWDTALTALALQAAGVERSHPTMVKACNWLVDRQISVKGDWSVKRPGLVPGGWAFEFINNWYPDIDDTAVVLMLLNDSGRDRFISEQNLERALRWIFGMQGKDGGWGAFDVDNNMEVFNQTPFGDLEAMVDPSTPDITGRVLELLGQLRYPASSKEVKAALKFLKKTQEKDGLWWGRWGVNYVYGTWSVLVGLQSIGEDMDQPYIRKAAASLKRHQNQDGGWGECCESYHDRELRICGTSTPSQTAWAVMALIAAGQGKGKEVARGVLFLLENQKPDGTWDEREFTATGFPKHFMINYHNYRNCFPLMALGKFVNQFKGEADSALKTQNSFPGVVE